MQTTQFKVYKKNTRNAITIGTLVEAKHGSHVVFDTPINGGACSSYELKETNIKEKGFFIVSVMQRIMQNDLSHIKIGNEKFEPKPVQASNKDNTTTALVIDNQIVKPDSVFKANIGGKTVEITIDMLDKSLLAEVEIPVGKYCNHHELNHLATDAIMDYTLYRKNANEILKHVSRIKAKKTDENWMVLSTKSNHFIRYSNSKAVDLYKDKPEYKVFNLKEYFNIP